jgi:predicted RNA binding protein YcfA (HicA-like mRNA interferase family)
MEGLPSQLHWKDFEVVLRRLGYSLHKSKRGSARTYFNGQRQPEFVTFHEPHSPKTLPKGTLRAYIRKLRLSPQEFQELLRRL